MFTYRRATTDDIELIRSIAKVAFPATYSTIISAEQIDYMMEWMYSAEKLQQEISGNITYLLAEVDGRTVGYLSFGPDEGAAAPGQGRLFHLHKIYLLPEAQGGGFFMNDHIMRKELYLVTRISFCIQVIPSLPPIKFRLYYCSTCQPNEKHLIILYYYFFT